VYLLESSLSHKLSIVLGLRALATTESHLRKRAPHFRYVTLATTSAVESLNIPFYSDITSEFFEVRDYTVLPDAPLPSGSDSFSQMRFEIVAAAPDSQLRRFAVRTLWAEEPLQEGTLCAHGSWLT
jgi:hypothetical protein